MTRFACIAVLAISAGCTGTEVGNPVVDIDFELSNRGEVTAARLAVERVRLRPAADCNGSTELDIPGPFVIDLFIATPLPELSDLEVSEAGYCRFEVKWGGADELGGASMVFGGTRASDGTPFELTSVRSDELRLDAVDTQFPIDDATNALFVAFDGNGLFADVDLEGADVDPDGTIYIDDTSNPDLLDAFEGNVDAATQLFDDDDDDGQLDDDERDPDDVLAE